MIGSDFSEPMLDLARTKAAGRDAGAVRFEWGDALDLTYDDATFDAVTVGFGVRNLADLDRGIGELTRVLKPGGRLVILEITQPSAPAALDLLRPLVRPPRAAARHPGRRPRRLHLPARVGEAVPAAGGPGDDHGSRRPRAASATRSSPAGSSRSTRVLARSEARSAAVLTPMNRSAVPPPVTRVLAAAEGWLPRRMGAVETRLAELAARGRRAPVRAGRARRSPPAASGCARCWYCVCAGDEAGGRRDPGRDRDRARPHGDAGPRRRPRRGAAATRQPDRRRPRRPRRRDRGRRSAVLARVRRARRRRSATPPARWRCSRGASVGLAQGELAQRRDAFDLSIAADRYLERCRLKTAQPVRMRVPDRRRPGRRGCRCAGAPIGARDRACLSAARRRPRRQRVRPSEPARRSAPTCSTGR